MKGLRSRLGQSGHTSGGSHLFLDPPVVCLLAVALIVAGVVSSTAAGAETDRNLVVATIAAAVGNCSDSIAVGWCLFVVGRSDGFDVVDVAMVGYLIGHTRRGSAIVRIGVRAGSPRSEICDNGVRW